MPESKCDVMKMLRLFYVENFIMGFGKFKQVFETVKWGLRSGSPLFVCKSVFGPLYLLFNNLRDVPIGCVVGPKEERMNLINEYSP